MPQVVRALVNWYSVHVYAIKFNAVAIESWQWKQQWDGSGQDSRLAVLTGTWMPAA